MQASFRPLPVRSARRKSYAVRAAAVGEAANDSSRRQLMAGLVSAGVMLVMPRSSTAATSCDLISSPSGLQYCDVRVGEGAEPAKGALIRSAAD